MARLISGLEDDVILSYLTYCPQMNTMKLNGQARLTSKPFLPIISGKIIGFSGINTQIILVENCEFFFSKNKNIAFSFILVNYFYPNFFLVYKKNSCYIFSITDYLKWCRCKALFFLKAKEREFDANQVPSVDSETDSSDDVSFSTYIFIIPNSFQSVISYGSF